MLAIPRIVIPRDYVLPSEGPRSGNVGYCLPFHGANRASHTNCSGGRCGLDWSCRGLCGTARARPRLPVARNDGLAGVEAQSGEFSSHPSFPNRAGGKHRGAALHRESGIHCAAFRWLRTPLQPHTREPSGTLVVIRRAMTSPGSGNRPLAKAGKLAETVEQGAQVLPEIAWPIHSLRKSGSSLNPFPTLSPVSHKYIDHLCLHT